MKISFLNILPIFQLAHNGHLYVVGRDFDKKSCQTRRKVGARPDLSDRQDTRLLYTKCVCPA